jgi:hypothetical protein
MARKPDYWVKAMNKATNEKRKIGAAWTNPDQSISIDIDAFTVLSAHPNLVITMFPIDRSGKFVSDEEDPRYPRHQPEDELKKRRSKSDQSAS